MKLPNSEKSDDSPWQKTRYANLRRYKPSKTYYVWAKVGGKQIRESLKTDSITVAKDRLDEKLKSERRLFKTRQENIKGRMTFGDALLMYQIRVQGSPDLRPRTKAYYDERITALKKSWPELERLDLSKLSKVDCQNWAAKFAPTTSPDAYNHTVAVLKHTFEIGIDLGVRYDNPAAKIKRAKVAPKELNLPSESQFSALINSIRHAGGGFSRHCADLVEFLSYGGFRKTEAAYILWKDVKMDANGEGTIFVRGADVAETNNPDTYSIPIIPNMSQLLRRLRAEAGGRPDPNSPVMKVNECQKAIDSAIKRLADPEETNPPIICPRITHHDCRHYFATRCIESGVDIPTVAKWLNHKDGGALALKVYGHLRQEHSVAMARKVKFGTSLSTEQAPPGADSSIEKIINVNSGNSDTSHLQATA